MSYRSTSTTRPFIGGRQRACSEHAGDMTLVVLAAMNAARRIDVALQQRDRFGDRALANDLACKRAACRLRKHRPVAGVAKADARFDALRLPIEPHGGGDSDDGEIAAAPRH